MSDKITYSDVSLTFAGGMFQSRQAINAEDQTPDQVAIVPLRSEQKGESCYATVRVMTVLKSTSANRTVSMAWDFDQLSWKGVCPADLAIESAVYHPELGAIGEASHSSSGGEHSMLDGVHGLVGSIDFRIKGIDQSFTVTLTGSPGHVIKRF